MIASVSPVSSGELRILGMDPAVDGPRIRGRIGVCPQEDTLDTELNVRDNLYIYGRYFGLPRAEVRQRVDELLEFVQLGETIALVTPAFPETGRSVYQGNLFVGAVPLNESPLKDHPLNPMRDANLVRVLGRQSGSPARRPRRSQSAVSMAASASEVIAPTAVAWVAKRRSRQIPSISSASRPISRGANVSRNSAMTAEPPVPMV